MAAFRKATLAGRAALLLLTAGVAGCSLFGSTEHVIPPLKSDASLRQLSPRWHVDFSDSGIPLAPGVSDGRVYVARTSGDLEALDATSGSVLWKGSVNTRLSGGVGAGAHHVALGTQTGQVILFDEDGHEQWRMATGGSAISAPPLISDDVVVARTGDGKLLGLDLATGKRRWMLERSLPPLTLYRASSATAGRGALFLAMPGGKLLALTTDKGKVGWEAVVAIPRGATELERVADVTGTPVTGERDVCAASYQGRVACFDASTGNPLWSRETSSVSGLAADSGRVYVGDEKGVVSAWDRTTGSPAWKNDTLSGRRLIGAVAAAGTVVTGDLQGYVHWLERSDGKLVARGATDGSSLNQQPVFLGDGVLVQTRDGGLYAFPMP